MKTTIYILALSALLFPMGANAKYNPPKDVPQVSQAQRIAVAEMSGLDKDEDGRLSMAEFKAKVNTYTRLDEKNARRARKKGFYQTPEQQFKAADVDNDGFLTYKELSDYITQYQKNDKGRAQYY